MTSAAADDGTTIPKTSRSIVELPAFPGEEFLAHAGTQWLELAEARLAAAKLLAVAQGHAPPATTCIIDVDLADLPMLPESHRDHVRRLETRIKIEAQNKANAQKRFTLTMEAWTEVYTVVRHGRTGALCNVSRGSGAVASVRSHRVACVVKKVAVFLPPPTPDNPDWGASTAIWILLLARRITMDC